MTERDELTGWMNQAVPQVLAAACEVQEFMQVSFYACTDDQLPTSPDTWLSELPYCRSMEAVDPPAGMELVTNGAIIATHRETGQTRVTAEHRFVADPDTGLIVDFFAAQAVPGIPDYTPDGAGIGYLMEHGPGHVVVLDEANKLAAVIGTRDELETAFGFRYFP